MVWGIVDFGDTQVRSVMTPRVDMVVASEREGLDALAELFLESGHSRIPLYDGSIDKIVGILHIRDLLRGLRSEPRPPARELTKPPFFVPERRPLDELLKEMQARYQQLAIVLDEYGGTAGLVTVEDMLEEIVGEIFDEDEVAAELEPMALPDGSWRLDGRTPVEKLDELFGVDLEEEPYETVAGVVLAVRGAVPAGGETVTAHGLRIDVEEVVGRRIRTVRVEKIPPQQAAEETA
jgi:CBS domain containing-hemolysin-like protein